MKTESSSTSSETVPKEPAVLPKREMTDQERAAMERFVWQPGDIEIIPSEKTCDKNREDADQSAE